jgi:hypothetical protein
MATRAGVEERYLEAMAASSELFVVMRFFDWGCFVAMAKANNREIRILRHQLW